MPKNRGRLSSNWAQIKDSVGVKYTMVLFTPSRKAIPSVRFLRWKRGTSMAENFKNREALDQVKRVIDEANAAVNDPSRTIKSSAMGPELTGALGAAGGAGLSFAALYSLGVTGLSAAGITSGLAAAGAVVGGGMAAGVGVLAAPVVLGYALLARNKHKQLMREKRELYNMALQKQNQLIMMLQKQNSMNKERADYLNSLVIMLKAAVRDLQADLAA